MKTLKQPAFKQLLRKSGYKATPSRLLVLGVLAQAKKPPSAQDVADAIRGKMDQATVYRTLKLFKTKGIIRQIDLRHNHAHYELASADKEHHHLICIHCGRIEDVEKCNVLETHGAILRHAKHFAEITQHSLEFYGVCKSCVKKIKGESL